LCENADNPLVRHVNLSCIACSYGSATVNQAADRKQDDGSAAGRVYDIKVEDFDISFGKRCTNRISA